jgi:hypothetical protein
MVGGQEEAIMRRTATTFLLATAALFAACASFARSHGPECAAPATPDLVGLWETRGTSKGGIGHTIELRADGTFVEAITVLVSFDYHVAGDKIFVSEPGRKDDGAPFRIEGDTLIQPGPDGSSIRKERVGRAEAGNSPLVGIWRYRHYTGGIAYERYTADGKLYFRLPMKGSKGCFEVNDDRLSLKGRGRKDSVVRIALNGDELTVRTPGDSPPVYDRSAAGPWYDREHIDIKLPAR